MRMKCLVHNLESALGVTEDGELDHSAFEGSIGLVPVDEAGVLNGDDFELTINNASLFRSFALGEVYELTLKKLAPRHVQSVAASVIHAGAAGNA